MVFKIRESPTKVKKRAKILLEKLKKFSVVLGENGNVDYSQVTSAKDLKALKDNETLIKVLLMEKDLEFEYPHKLGKILPPLGRPKPPPEQPPTILTYENYYGLDPKSNIQNIFNNYNRRS